MRCQRDKPQQRVRENERVVESESSRYSSGNICGSYSCFMAAHTHGYHTIGRGKRGYRRQVDELRTLLKSTLIYGSKCKQHRTSAPCCDSSNDCLNSHAHHCKWLIREFNSSCQLMIKQINKLRFFLNYEHILLQITNVFRKIV